MADPLISVIVPIYNVDLYIEKCVRSLLEQSYKNIEYVFVNDCCTDASMKVLDDVIIDYPHRQTNIKIIDHAENLGLPSARNSGLLKAEGEFIYHCDSDDWTDVKLLEELYRVSREQNADIVYCDMYNVYGDKLDLYKQSEGSSYVDFMNDLFYGRSQGSVCNKLIKRSLYITNNIRFPDKLPMLEDLRTVVQLYYFAQQISYCPLPLYFYVKTRQDSISAYLGQRNQELRADRVANVMAIEDFLIKKGIVGIEEGLMNIKLGAKKNLLIKGESLSCYKQWRDVFPESNSYTWKTKLPLYYKIVAWCADKKIWVLIRIWLLVKYKLIKPNI